MSEGRTPIKFLVVKKQGRLELSCGLGYEPYDGEYLVPGIDYAELEATIKRLTEALERCKLFLSPPEFKDEEELYNVIVAALTEDTHE